MVGRFLAVVLFLVATHPFGFAKAMLITLHQNGIGN